MLLNHSFGQKTATQTIETAIEKVLESGVYTRDIAIAGSKIAVTKEMGDAISKKIKEGN